LPEIFFKQRIAAMMAVRAKNLKRVEVILTDTEAQGQNTEKEKQLNRSFVCVSAHVTLFALYKAKMLTIVESDSTKIAEIFQG
jgi:hypothetical protein